MNNKVELLSHFGNDLMIVNVARVSYGKEVLTLEEKDNKLNKKQTDMADYTNKYGDTYQLKVNISENRISLIDTKDGMPYATASTYIPGLSVGEYAIKDYSENEGILNFLLENNIIEAPHRFAESGYVTIPICKLKNTISVGESYI
jgi:phosphoribosylformylglycinamidine (FGAM) synthase-like amidotransferase family enzyme